jgi:benzodiazapine receptor
VNSKNFFRLIFFIILCELAGILGSLFTFKAIPGWYATLEKPVLNPPGWVFGPVWTMLYALMGIAAFLVYQKGWKRSDVKQALAFFSAQLFLNAIWSIFFFGLHRPGLALIDIVLLWIMIAITIFQFQRISRSAAWLLMPYLAWVSFATYLNAAIYSLNR